MSYCMEWFLSFVRGAMIVAPVFPDELVHRVFFVMQAYLTNGWRLSFTHAAGIMNFWEGMTLVLPTFLQFLADSVLRNFTVAVISSIFSAAGIGMVALSVPHILDHNKGRCQKPGVGSCLNDAQAAIFYTGMVLTALGRAGISFSIDALQYENSPDEPNSQGAQGSSARVGVLACLHNAIKKYIKICTEADKYAIYLIGSLLVMIWIHKWKLLFGLPAIYSAYMTVSFICGWWCYKRCGPTKRSPITMVVCIIYAAATSSNKSRPLIQDHNDQKPSGVFFPRCLDKALPSEGQGSPHNKRTFEENEVEVAKFVVGMVPISLTFIFCGIVSSIGNTYFVEQANHMNRRLGKWNAPLLALQLPIITFKLFLDLHLWLIFKKKDWIRNNCKIDLPIAGIRAAMLCSVCCCVTAAIMEMKRLKVVRSHGLVDKPDYEEVPMHAAWLLFQFFFLAGLDSLLRKSIEEFYTDQAPQHLRKEPEGSVPDGKARKRYLKTAVDFVCGLGFVFGVLSVYVVGKLSEIGGNPNWFRYTLNQSRLDRYYWVLAGLSGVNLVVFQLVALGYVRRPSEGRPDSR